MNRRVAIYGGTFDPIHFGHLRSIAELQERLSLDQVRLVPSYTPPHRDLPCASPQQRLEMLKLGLEAFEGIIIDEREIERQGVSYSVETLRDVRREVNDDFGADTQLFFILGSDAFALLDEWREWQRLVDYCHLVVMDRPGTNQADINPLVLEWVADKLVDDPAQLHAKTAGNVCRVHLKQWDISATQIRECVSKEQSIEIFLPTAVSSYITTQHLYR